MAPLFIYKNALLVRDGKLAVSRNCCCGVILCIKPWGIGMSNTRNFPECIMTWLSAVSKNCLECGETTIETTLQTGLTGSNSYVSFSSDFFYDCSSPCLLNPEISYNRYSYIYNRTDTSVTYTNPVSLNITVSLDVNKINTDYPESDGWEIIWSGESLLNETPIDLGDCNIVRCQKWALRIQIYAIKNCTSDDPGFIEEITDAVKLSDNISCQDTSPGGPYQNCPDCPNLPNITLSTECLEECPGSESPGDGNNPGDGLI